MAERMKQDPLALLLHQQAQRCQKLDQPVPGRFVTGAQLDLARHEANAAGISVSFWGGWEDADRVQVCFHPDWAEPEYTARWVTIRWNARFSACEHRDLLGSLMALGIEHEYFGDLMIEEAQAHLFTLPETAARLPDEWHEAGHTPITVAIPEEPPEIHPPRGEQIRDTVASLRLDSVLSAGLSCSRAKAAELIRAGRVQVNHQLEERVDRLLQSGMLLSVRGFGRIRLLAVGEPTRKDRLPVTLEVFGRS